MKCKCTKYEQALKRFLSNPANVNSSGEVNDPNMSFPAKQPPLLNYSLMHSLRQKNIN